MATLRKVIGHAHLIGDLEPVSASQAESAREPVRNSAEDEFRRKALILGLLVDGLHNAVKTVQDLSPPTLLPELLGSAPRRAWRGRCRVSRFNDSETAGGDTLQEDVLHALV